MDKELPVSVWPEWKIIEKIGEGSFGKVYKAERKERGLPFYSAIKIISIPGSKGELDSVRSEMSDEKSTREYFHNLAEDCIQEIYTMEHFRGNSHVVSVEDFKVVEYLDEIGWDISIRMEYLTSFLDYCTGKELTEREVIKLGCDLGRALTYCRKLNIIHRDVKPENIFVSRFGDFKLGDFGIAREQAHTMGSMSKKGTYSYMAPEMYRGGKYDSSVDIYSLGIVLYKLMNQNRLPFISLDKQLITYRDKENALTRRMSGEQMPRPAQASAAFSRIILKACAYRPEDRYAQPEDFLHDLEDLQNGRHLAEKQWEKSQWELASAEDMELAQRQLSQARNHQESGESIRNQAEPGSGLENAQADEEPGLKKRSRKKDSQDTRDGKSGGNRRQKKNRQWNEGERQISPWAISIIIIAIAACIITGAYTKLILDEDRRAQRSDNVIKVLEANDNSTAQIDDFSMAIQTVVEQANTIAEMLPQCEEVVEDGQRIRYYDSEGKLVKALLYPEMSEEGVYEEYYYWDERLFFAYIWTNEKEELYYYDSRGKLIRWIDTDGVVHDKETDSTEYTKRGEKYWKIALEQLDE